MIKRLLKYLGICLFSIFILCTVQNIVIRIPNKYIKDNIVESLKYYDEQAHIDSVANRGLFFGDSLSIHYYSDCITLNMIDNINSNKPFMSHVLMEYYYVSGNTMCDALHMTVNTDVEANTEYSRYWHGSILFIKPLLIFMNVKTMKIILGIIFFTLIAYLIYLILKKSPLLAVLFSLSLLSVMFYIVPMCFEYFFAFLIAIISSIIVMKNIDKDDKFYYKLFTIVGVLACFFDFLAYEVLTIMIPLFLKVYFDTYKSNEIDFRKEFWLILKCSLLWGVSYVLTFVLKWGLSVMVLGPSQWLAIWNKAKVRIYDMPFSSFYIFGQGLTKIASMIFPFSLFNKAPVLFIIYIFIIFYFYFLYTNKEQKKYLTLLLIIASIGILRLCVLFTHTWGHYFFDYRNLLPFMLWSFIVIYESFFRKDGDM